MMTKSTNPFVNEDLIQKLVNHFYQQVQKDPEIGPVFNEKIKDWPRHLNIMCDFWSSIVLKTNRFHGRPMLKHQLIAKSVSRADFIVWLRLFYQAVEEVCPVEAQKDFTDAAQRIAESLQIGMFDRPFDVEEVKRHLEFLEVQECASA